jgi:DNA-binding NarL/FixJ family response regulator/class 3 adenylate cyclase
MVGESGGRVRAFLIADIRGFTRFTNDLGDEEASRLAARFSSRTRECVERREAELVEVRGDEALVVFDSVREAIRAAVELQQAYVAAEAGSDPLPVGIGVDAGEAVLADDDYHGAALNLAARLCSLAAAGEVLVSQEAAHLAGKVEGVRLEDRGSVRLKNLPDPVRVLRAAPETDDPADRFLSLGPSELAPLRVVLADDSVLFREGVARMLSEAGFEIAGTAGDADGLIELVRGDRPDVAVVDIRMPPTNTNEGLLAAARIREESPTVGVLVLSQYVESHHAVKLLESGSGGVGYLLKDRVADVGELAEAVRRVASGGSVIDPEVVAQLLRRRRERDPIEELTAREREILALMAEGRSNQAICERLFLSPKTVETHVGHIFDKLALIQTPDDHRRVLAVVAFLRSG